MLPLWFRQPFACRGRGVATIVHYRKSFAWMGGGGAVTMVQSHMPAEDGVVTMVQAVLCLLPGEGVSRRVATMVQAVLCLHGGVVTTVQRFQCFQG